MDEFWILIFVSFFAINSLDKAESVDLFDEIFGEGWWNKDKAVEWHKLTLEQNALYQIDRQNTQIGQIEPYSTDQNPPHFTESDHYDNAKNGEEQNKITSNEKRKIVDKFHTMKDEFKQKGKYSRKEWVQIENEITKHLKVNRSKIYEWKKKLDLSRKFYEKEQRKHLVEKFDQMKDELKRAGFKDTYHHEIDETVAKKLGICAATIYAWKSELGQTKQNKYSHSEQKELMKHYYEIKDQSPKISDKGIAKMLKIGITTLYKWKKQFHPNSVDSVEVNATAKKNVQEFENTN